MWWSRKPAPVELTTDAFRRWLRAGRPPEFRWFLAQPTIVQETLAEQGDEYTMDVCLAIGYAVLNPVAAEAGIDAAENPESEEKLVAALAKQFAASLGSPNVPSDVPPAPRAPASMGGFGERRQAHIEARKAAARANGTFLGRKPDEAP